MKCEGGPWDGRNVPAEVLEKPGDSFLINDPDQLLPVIRGEAPELLEVVVRVGTYTRQRWSDDNDVYTWRGWQR